MTPALPTPRPGLVVLYEFLWLRDRSVGRTEPAYSHPAVILAVRPLADGSRQVLYAPVTHSAEAPVLAMPAAVARQAGLDGAPNYISVGALNEDHWPLGLQRRSSGMFEFGYLPRGFFQSLLDAVLDERGKPIVPVIRR